MFDKDIKILIVEDQESVALTLKMMLEDLGFKNASIFSSVSSAKDALNSSDDEFNLIISDMHMPEETGLDFLKYCKSEEKFSKIPFLMATGDVEQSFILSIAKAGVSSYLVKPYTIEDLEAKLEKISKKKS